MSIPLFAHDANPASDRPLCTVSRTTVLEMIAEGRVRILVNAKGKEYGVQFKLIVEHTLRSQLSAALKTTPNPSVETLLEIFKTSEGQSTSSISDEEMRAFVGDCETVNQRLRAEDKVNAWPTVYDDKAPTVQAMRAVAG
jgi:hypothetical protein